jgi:hypothetical protein
MRAVLPALRRATVDPCRKSATLRTTGDESPMALPLLTVGAPAGPTHIATATASGARSAMLRSAAQEGFSPRVTCARLTLSRARSAIRGGAYCHDRGATRLRHCLYESV